ncbi:MAG: hypothetical protein RLZZ70_756 [Candidatus Parcubacteria bacterium]|jgi:O-antigen/teichoic acid export membrane protein
MANLINKLKNIPETSHSIWMLSGQFVVSVSAFLLTYILANFVSKEVVGEYRFVLAAYSTISVFALYGISTALMQSVAAGASGSVFLAFKEKLRFGLVGSLLFTLLALYYLFYTPSESLFWALILCALLLPPLEAYGLYGSYLQGVRSFKLSAVFLSLDRVVTTGAVAISVYFSPTLLPLVATYLIAHCVMVYVLYTISIKHIPPNNDSDSKMISYAKHVTVMSLFSAVISQLDKYILFFFFGPVPLALYWIASVLPQEVARVVSVISGTFFPRYVTMEQNALMRVVRKLYWVSALILGLVCVAYAFSAPFIFEFFLPQYTDADGISIVLMFGLGFIPYFLVWQIFSAKKNVPVLYYLSIGEPVLTVLLYIGLIPLFGIWGLVYAICIRTIIMNLLALCVLYKYL